MRNMWVGWARGEDMLDYGRVITQCNHGCVLMIPDGNHPVAIFMHFSSIASSMKVHLLPKVKASTL